MKLIFLRRTLRGNSLFATVGVELHSMPLGGEGEKELRSNWGGWLDCVGIGRVIRLDVALTQ
jgi:hypothetical protein